MKLQGLPNWTVQSYVVNDAGAHQIKASYDVMPDACKTCGSPQIYNHGSKVAFYKDMPINDRKTFLEVKRVRFRCRSCGSTQMQALPDIDDNHRITRRCAEHIVAAAQTSSNLQVARDVGVDEKTVRRILNAAIVQTGRESHPK